MEKYKLLYTPKTNVFGGILESANLSVCPCVCLCTKYYFLSKHWQGYQITFNDGSSLFGSERFKNLVLLLQVKGGSGYNGGGGGRLAIEYGHNNTNSYFEGEYYSDGGANTGKENGAAGTVYLKDVSDDGQKHLRIYNIEGNEVWKPAKHKFQIYFYTNLVNCSTCTSSLLFLSII